MFSSRRWARLKTKFLLLLFCHESPRSQRRLKGPSYPWRPEKLDLMSNSKFWSPGSPKVSHICWNSLLPLVEIFLVFEVDDERLLFRLQDASLEDSKHWWHIPFETPDMTKNKIQFNLIFTKWLKEESQIMGFWKGNFREIMKKWAPCILWTTDKEGVLLPNREKVHRLSVPLHSEPKQTVWLDRPLAEASEEWVRFESWEFGFIDLVNLLPE